MRCTFLFLFDISYGIFLILEYTVMSDDMPFYTPKLQAIPIEKIYDIFRRFNVGNIFQ